MMATDLLRMPHSPDSEEVVIGGLLFHGRALFSVLEVLTDPEDFYFNPFVAIFRAMLALDSNGEPIDVVTVNQQLERVGEAGALTAHGGTVFLLDLSTRVATVDNIGWHARVVRDLADARRLILAADRVMARGRLLGSPGGPQDVAAYQDEAQAALFGAARQRPGAGPRPIPEVVCEAMAEVHRAMSAPPGALPIPTGYPSLDRDLAGLHAQELVIIAARPSMGKSALMGCLAVGGAKAGVPQLVFSLEMSAASLAMRLACGEVHLDGNRLRGKPEAEAVEQARRGAGMIAELPIDIDDDGSLNLMELRSRSRRWRSQHKGRGVIWVDYLQLITPGKADNREQEISQISRGLKALAKELDVSVVALSQLNRGLEQRRDKRPLCSDLRESGSLEQDADTVLFVYRDEVYNPTSQDKGTAEIIIGKQRNGPTKTVRLAYLAPSTRFEELTTRHEPPLARERQGALL